MKKWIAMLLCIALTLPLTGCSSGDDGKTIRIYDGQYSEMKIIHQMIKLLVEEETDAEVKIMDEMSPVNSFNELIKGNADLVNSYDGTLLTTFLKYDPSDVPEGETVYEFANEKAEEKGIHLLDKLGTDNSYAIAVTQEVAEKYDLETISDLVPVAGELVFGAEHEFFSEEGSARYNPMIEFYGLYFKEGKPVDIGLKYFAVESGYLDVVLVYQTDGLNKKANLKILEDDKHFFPEYNGAILVRDDIFEKFKEVAPNLEEVLNELGGTMTNDDMVNMTYECDVEGRSPQDVAKEFLQSKGLIS